MFRIGLELEEFCVDNKSKEVVLIPKDSNIPHDGCGWLIEYRSEPCKTIVDAVFSLKADEYKAKNLLTKFGVTGVRSPVMKPSKDVRMSARKRFIKSLVKFNNIYGYKCHKNTLSEAVAAVHISITFSVDGKNGRVNKLWDYADFIRYMDEAFEKEIAESKRRPGFYEIKSDGRFEYRSLPNNIDLDKLMQVVSRYRWKY
ncbi:hypothetical protein JZU46_00825 [bacterium]|nr:hypothetical protein [bacterium]